MSSTTMTARGKSMKKARRRRDLFPKKALRSAYAFDTEKMKKNKTGNASWGFGSFSFFENYFSWKTRIFQLEKPFWKADHPCDCIKSLLLKLRRLKSSLVNDLCSDNYRRLSCSSFWSLQWHLMPTPFRFRVFRRWTLGANV